MTDTAEPEVLVRREGRALRLTLNRPRVINALTPEMIAIIADALDAAASDPAVEVVVLDGAGERGLCAGGDIRMSVSGDPERLRQFWEDEYVVDLVISRFPKPFVALMDGITMGGGIGLSAHAAFRVVTERSRLALPETRIGFIPDVGGSLLLARAPGELGVHLGLTAGDLDAGDAVLCGFADHYVPADRLSALLDAIAHGSRSIPEEIAALELPAPPSRLAAHRPWIDACYVAEDVSDILIRLDERPEQAAREAAATLREVSPTSIVLALALIRRSREIDDLEAVLALELKIGTALLETHDVIEGVRAQIVDKDRNPKWLPATLAEVDRARVATLVGD